MNSLHLLPFLCCKDYSLVFLQVKINLHQVFSLDAKMHSKHWDMLT